jgi:4-hydroxy-tetrahydrodipicolinate reductase
MTLRIGLFGRGRLGAAIAAAAAAEPRVRLVWQIGKGTPPAEAIDVAIDASHAEAVSSHVAWAVAQGVDLVIGTTGWQEGDLAAQVGQRCGVMIAPNFSLTVALLSRLSLVLARYAAQTGGDPFLWEHHHRYKADAPSGTARRLAAQIMAGCPQKRETTLGPAGPHQLSIGVVRAGGEFGTHVVGVDWPEEIMEIRHSARSRAVFARGAVQAALWLRGKRGVFHFEDLAAELLNPLFSFGTGVQA